MVASFFSTSSSSLDSDGSWHSTVSVTPKRFLSKPATLSRRGVRFCDEITRSYESPWSAEDFQAMWYSKADFKPLRKALRQTTDDIQQRDKRLALQQKPPPQEVSKKKKLVLYKGTLEAVYEKCCCGQASEAADASFRCLSPLHQRRLENCLGKSLSRLGLERLTLVDSLGKERPMRRKYLVHKIRQLSLECDSDSDRIAHACRSISHPSRLFAHYHAQALSAVQV